ncbi:MAG: leucyl aminopeptidase family protein [Alphaproteobacteria bacterium]
MHAIVPRAAKATPIDCVSVGKYPSWLKQQPVSVRNMLAGLAPKAGVFRSLTDAQGRLSKIIVITRDVTDIWDLAALPLSVAEGNYRLTTPMPPEQATLCALGWELGAYQFTRYKKPGRKPAQLLWPAGADRAYVSTVAEAVARARDLINTPAEDMGPQELAAEVRTVGQAHGAQFHEIVGDRLLKENYPLLHAVGRASHRPPRLIELRWGKARDPLVTLVGKGVCFDTGGLDIKPSSAMYLMKKDMGGAATALAVAEMVMALRLPIRLRLLIPAVENAISGNAYRPSDVFRARNGLTVEIGNTDAEGRLILADALAAATESDRPACLIDFATLTGAARTALGTELPALFANDDLLAEALLAAGRGQSDPMWRLPLAEEYKVQLQTRIADLNSAPNSPYAGAITAALFLEYFVGKTPWAHIDLMGWHLVGKPGRPEGGAPMTARAVLAMLSEKFDKRRQIKK